MGNRVWLVSEGVYSDMRIVGVYSSLELAEAAADAMGTDCGIYDTDGIEVDAEEAAIRSGISSWRLFFSHAGDITFSTKEGLPRGQVAQVTAMAHGMIVHCDAPNLDHAIKIAADARAQHLALSK